jgi:hypothetical protein
MNGLRAYLLTAPQRQTLQAYPDGALAWNPTEIMPYGRDILRSEDPKLVLSRLIYRGAKARVERVLVNGSRVDGEKL